MSCAKRNAYSTIDEHIMVSLPTEKLSYISLQFGGQFKNSLISTPAKLVGSKTNPTPMVMGNFCGNLRSRFSHYSLAGGEEIKYYRNACQHRLL